ncbi:ribonucleoside-triphosphate reductase, adenosylcobalamin-dependent [Actinocorallia libanotica]|uniref:Adenosylcobalamin-dependent ribonucleoside-triphosphate reductase n=1 Tax=Actinocorallia libanotica TaxID=46162 RepID=A0ABN1RXM0_9ACTN
MTECVSETRSIDLKEAPINTMSLPAITDSIPAIVDIPWGPTGQTVYERTYSRTKADGSRETWPETVRRVVAGNLGLVYGEKETWSPAVRDEYEQLVKYMEKFAILPAGRHLWASGVKGRQYLFNCHVAPWGETLSRHFEFTFLRLMEGGGVGSNYSSSFLRRYGVPRRPLDVHVVCDPAHPDFAEMKAAGVLSSEYDSNWAGAFEVEDSREGWASALVDLIDTFMTDGEVKHRQRVYDVSRVRCKGSRLKTFGGTASGPAPFARMMVEVGRILSLASNPASRVRPEGGFYGHLTPVEAMDIDHAIAECVVSGGNRRSARMAIVHWADPFIAEFLRCKLDPSRHWTTNISVEIDDEFLALIDSTKTVNLDKARQAGAVLQAVVEGMLTNGEPGLWNSSRSNRGEVNRVIATNPCGEIALPPTGACVLGHVNMDHFAPTRKGGPADVLNLVKAHRLMTRFLIRATYGDMRDAEQKAVMEAERRIGVGHFGVQGFFAKSGIRYSDVPDNKAARRLLRELYEEVRKEARSYAFELRIPEPVKVTTEAPTGSVAKLPGVSEGIHAIYGRYFLRRVRFSLADPQQEKTVNDLFAKGYRVETCIYDKSGNTLVVEFPTKDKLVAEVEAMGYPADIVQSADELKLEQMLAFQAMYQEEYADNAVSYTANVRPGLDVLETANTLAHWLPRLKGTTIMVDGTREQAPYERITRQQFEQYHETFVEDSTDPDCASGACPVR